MKRTVALQMSILIMLILTGCEANTEKQEKTVLTEKTESFDLDTTEFADDDFQEGDNQLSIIMVGDMLLHDRIEAVNLDEDGTYCFDEIFNNVGEIIEEADIAIANQEVILGGKGLGISGYPAFNGPYEFADDLVEAGFDVICHGTNHALDKGAQGIENCLEYWRNTYSDIEVVGIHDCVEDQEQVSIIERNGFTVALLNYTYGTNGIHTPTGKEYLVDYLEEERVIGDLQYASNNSDFVIVCPHWGTEYTVKETEEQRKWARLFVENGADLVIGTHPHVIEPIEWIEYENKKALIYYSIGNFVNWTSGTGPGVSNRMVGGIASIKLSKKDDGDVEILDYGVIPIVSHVTSEKHGVTVYTLDEYTQELADMNEINNQVDDFSLTYCKRLVKDVWGIE